MSRILRVGMIQMPVDKSKEANISYLTKAIEEMMEQYTRPEIIIAGEFNLSFEAETIPGPISDHFCKLAKKYGIYMLPGSYPEKHSELKENEYYNAAPIINPEGEIIEIYRKMFPYYPMEESRPGKNYVVFDMPEKNTKIGVQICYDVYFPEVSRNEALMGAEVLVKLTMDMQPLLKPYRYFPVVRAVENQAYFISVNDVGNIMGCTLYGHSMVADPNGNILFEADGVPNNVVFPIDLDVVSVSREYGTLLMDQTMKHLASINPPQPFSKNFSDAPLYKNLGAPSDTTDSFIKKIADIGICKNKM